MVGYAGELHPRSARRSALPARHRAGELDLDVLLPHAAEIVAGARRSPPSRSPRRTSRWSSTRPCRRPTSRRRCAPAPATLLESVRLFDVYEGEQVGEGKKSLAYALRFRAPDRTLTEDEVRAARDAAVAEAAERTGAVQRA